MLKTLKDLFDSFTTAAASPSPAQLEHTLQLATAVLLVEVMRADPAMSAPERSAVLAALREKFSLGDDELQQLVTLAEQEAQAIYDYHRFTSALNEHFSQTQKIQIGRASCRERVSRSV